MTKVRCVWSAGATLGEGPVWDAARGCLYWLDIPAGRIMALWPAQDRRVDWHLSGPVAALAPAADGHVVAALASGFALLDLAGTTATMTPLGNPESDRPGNRFNDGKLDPHGRFWAGSMDQAEQSPTGRLWLLQGPGRWRQLAEGFTVFNGPAFAPDGHHAYFTDSPRRTVWRAPLAADGGLGVPEVFARFGEEDGHPDGMTVDAAGGLWVAAWGGGRVVRFRPDGQRDHAVQLPVSNVSSCAFGGDDLRTLFITTARKDLDAEALEAQPLAGGLFACEPGVAGLLPGRWKP